MIFISIIANGPWNFKRGNMMSFVWIVAFP